MNRRNYSYPVNYPSAPWTNSQILQVVFWAVLLVICVILLALIIRMRWKSIKPGLMSKTPAVLALEQPGLLATHLQGDRWQSEFRTALTAARDKFASSDDALAKQAVSAMNDALASASELGAATADAAGRSIRTGGLESLLIKNRDEYFYVLAFPGRHEPARLLHRYPPLASGWVEHAAALRKDLAGTKGDHPLLCLLWFFSGNVRGGSLLVAYESPEGRLLSGELAEEEKTGEGHTLRFADRFPVQLA